MSRKSMFEYGIPDRMQGGLERYIQNRMSPGSFLRSILENDLRGACSCADSENRTILFNYVNYLYNEAPRQCWGSFERVSAWLAGRNEASDCVELEVDV